MARLRLHGDRNGRSVRARGVRSAGTDSGDRDRRGLAALVAVALAVSGPRIRIPVTAAGGASPIWSPDGRELLFRRGRAVISVPVQTTATGIDFGDERKLFEWDAASEWAMAPNGDIYSVEPVPGAALQSAFQLRTGWFGELERLIR